MEIYDLEVARRNQFGKNAARQIRRQGLVPAVLYGHMRESVPVTISPFDLEKIYKKSGSEQVILNIILKNGETSKITAMVREAQIDPVSRNLLHLDLFEISMDKEVVISVPVEVSGKPRGVERGGFLQIVRHELEVSCLPADMPEKIEIDITDLDIGDAVHIGDIKAAAGIKLQADPMLTVITVVAPTVVAEEIPREEAAEAEAGEEEAGAGEESE